MCAWRDGGTGSSAERSGWRRFIQSSSRLDVSDLLSAVGWRDLQCVGKMPGAEERGTMDQEVPRLVISPSTLIVLPFSSDHSSPCEHVRAAEMNRHSLVAWNIRSVFSPSSGDDVWSGVTSVRV